MAEPIGDVRVGPGSPETRAALPGRTAEGVARQRSVAVAGAVGAVVARYVLDLTVARRAGAATYGDYAVLLAYATSASMLAGLGFADLANREVTRLRHAGLVADGVAFEWVGSSVSVVLAAVVGALVGLAGARVGTLPAQAPAILALLVPALTSFAFGRQLSVISRHRTMGYLSQVGVLVLAALLVALASMVTTLTLTLIVAALVGAYLAVNAVQFAAGLGGKPTEGRYESSTLRRWLRSGGIVSLNNGATVLTSVVDLLFIGWFANAVTTGYYAAASRVSLLVTLALSGLVLRDGPEMGRLLARGEAEACWRYFRGSRRVSGALGALTALAIVLLGPILLGVFGPGFRSMWAVLVILTAGRLVSAATGPVAVLLIAAGRERVAATSAWIGLAIATALVIGLGHVYGPTGVAVGAAVGIAFQNLLQTFLARRTVLEARRG